MIIQLILLCYFGGVSIFGLFMLWKMRIEEKYFGFELLGTCIRWYLKMMLFEEINGWNYYFPLRFRSLWAGIHISLMTI